MESQPAQISIDVEAKENFPDALDWQSVFSDTLEILRNLTLAASSTSRTRSKWKIKAASLNSPLHMTLVAESPTGEDAQEAVKACIKGLRDLESETPPTEPPPLFNEATLRASKRLVSVLKRGVAAITFSSPEFGLVNPTLRIATNVDELIGAKFKAEGVLEGVLQSLSVHGGSQFNIYDPLTDDRIVCYFPKEHLEQAMAAFGRRVAVFGVIKYNKGGKIISVTVEDIKPLKQRSELRLGEDLVIDITDGVDPTEYVRRLWDDD